MNLGPIANLLTNRVNTLINGVRAIGSSPKTGVEYRAGIDAIELEPRVLYSASPIAIDLVDVPDDPNLNPVPDVANSLNEPGDFSVSAHESFFESIDFTNAIIETTSESEDLTSEIVFVDANITNLEQVVSELRSSTTTEVVVLRANEDGVNQITTTLAQRNGVTAIHILSHGSAGQIHLGSTTLSGDSLNAYSGEIAGWSASLSSGADILFYGCEVAGNESGRELVEDIRTLTGADVAASVDLTGHSTLGGDWQLEFVQGDVNSQIIAPQALQQTWISALAAPPTDGSAAIWIATKGNSSGSNGLNWGDDDIVQLGDPNLQLESPNTDGTFESTGFTFPDEIRGFHRVESLSVTIGDTTLQQGDLLLALGKNINFTGFSADRKDIVLYRPDSITDYSSGTYHEFLEEAVHTGGGGKNVHGISLIETDVTVGGHLLTEGTLVVSRSGSDDDDLFVVNVVTTSFGTTNSTNTDAEQRLIKGEGSGTNLDFGGKKIESIEVLENAITIGGQSLAAGTILVSIDTNSAQDVRAGSGTVSVNGNDLIALNVTQTEFDGSTDATPSILLDGSDIGLTSSNEKIFGLSVISPSLVSVDHVVTVDTTNDINDGTTSSITALLANKGTDGKISLREAIEAANNTTNNGSTPDEIRFDIQNNDAGHVYYRDDGIVNSLSVIAATTLSDSSITDFDPDYPYTPRSWFQIDLDNSLPQLSITDSVVIDGYSQSGASENTLVIGQNANLKIELTNSTANGSGSGQDNNVGIEYQTGANGSTLRGLAINGFGTDGVLIAAGVHNVTIQGNFLGTDITGTRDVGNSNTGIQIQSNNNLIGGSDVTNRNVISGNNSGGIVFDTSGTLTGNVVENNYIGVDATGLEVITNGSHGITLSGNDGVRVINNIVSGNQGDGIHALAGSTVQNAVIQGNLIGVGADGTSGLGNGGSGIRLNASISVNNTIGGTGTGEGNVISANGAHGIALDGNSVSNTSILGNFIGTDVAATAILGNGADGIFTTTLAFNNQIGGVLSGQVNVIANNAGSGINLTNTGGGLGYGNSIRGNRFFNNTGLAIDIKSDGVTANDYTFPIPDNDVGPNRVQNYPDLTDAASSGSDLTITGTLRGRNDIDYTIDFYATGTADTSGHGEADRYLGSILRRTNSSGFVDISNLLSSVSVAPGESITATATHSDGSTSEFSLNVTATSNNTAPSALGVAVLNILEDSPDQFLDLNAVFDDAEDADTALTYSIETITNSSLFNSFVIDSSNILRSSYAANQNGSTSVTLRATDTGGLFAETTFQINVAAVNDTPFIDTPINTHSANEDDTQSVISLLTTFDDIEDSILNYAVVSNDNTTLLAATMSGSDLVFDYHGDEHGTANVVIRATDSGGEMVDHTIAVSVNSINDAPQVDNPINTYAANEDDLPSVISLLTTFDDVRRFNTELFSHLK